MWGCGRNSASEVEATDLCICMYSNIYSCGFRNGNRASFVGCIPTPAPAIIRVVRDCNRPNFNVEVCVAVWAVGWAIHSLVGADIQVVLPHIIFACLNVGDGSSILFSGQRYGKIVNAVLVGVFSSAACKSKPPSWLVCGGIICARKAGVDHHHSIHRNRGIKFRHFDMYAPVRHCGHGKWHTLD